MPRRRPPHPNLEHLRNEAKALLKAQRRGDTAACQTLRLLNRFAKATDKGNPSHLFGYEFGICGTGIGRN